MLANGRRIIDASRNAPAPLRIYFVATAILLHRARKARPVSSASLEARPELGVITLAGYDGDPEILTLKPARETITVPARRMELGRGFKRRMRLLVDGNGRRRGRPSGPECSRTMQACRRRGMKRTARPIAGWVVPSPSTPRGSSPSRWARAEGDSRCPAQCPSACGWSNGATPPIQQRGYRGVQYLVCGALGSSQFQRLRDMDRHGQGGGLPWPWFWPVAGDGFLETSGEGRRAVRRI